MTNLVEAKPSWIPIQQMVPEDSIGADLIARIPDLGVRFRPETIFNQPLRFLWLPSKPVHTQLQKEGKTTIREVLAIPSDQLPQYNKRFKDYHFEERLIGYLKGLLQPPQARVLEWVFEVELEPAEPEREMELVSYVDEKINMLPPHIDRKSLIGYFGFDDGIRQTLERIGELENTSRQAINQRLKRTKSYIKKSWGEEMKGYFTLSRESFGRAVLGIGYRKDLPLAWNISQLDLSNSTRQEIESKGSSLLDDLANVNVADIILSEGALANLRQALKTAKEESERRKIEPEKDYQRSVNKLLEEVPTVEFTGIILLSLGHLKLHPRTANAIKKEIRKLKRESGEPVSDATIGDMIRLFTKETFIKIPGLGKQGISLVGRELQRVLQLPADSQLNIESLLISVFRSRPEKKSNKNDEKLGWMYMVVEEARIAGCQSVEQILERLKKRGYRESFKNYFQISKIDDWRVRAFIEYVLNHPVKQEVQKLN